MKLALSLLLLGLRTVAAQTTPPAPAFHPDPLLVSQFVLASAGTSYSLTRHSLLTQEPGRTVATSIGVVGLTIALERLYTPRSKKARVLMTIANFGASVAFSVLASKDIGNTRDKVRQVAVTHK